MRVPVSAGAGAVLLLTLALPACSKWQVEQASPEVLLTSDAPGTIRVERDDDTVVELVQAKVRDDTLSGLVPGSAAPGAPLRQVAIPLSDVRRVASKRGDLRRTLGAMAMVPLVYFGGSYLMQW
jgi:hypothetical protein